MSYMRSMHCWPSYLGMMSSAWEFGCVAVGFKKGVGGFVCVLASHGVFTCRPRICFHASFTSVVWAVRRWLRELFSVHTAASELFRKSLHLQHWSSKQDENVHESGSTHTDTEVV